MPQDLSSARLAALAAPDRARKYLERPPEIRQPFASFRLDQGNLGRLQSVRRDENPLYYGLIQAFERKSGIPVILNTSFNENEPIVCTPGEAIDCFKRTRMDALAIGSYLAVKSES